MTRTPPPSSDASEDSDNPLLTVVRRYGLPYWPYFLVGLVVDVGTIVLWRIPEYVIGIAVDAVFLESGPYALPVVPEAMIPATRLDQLWFTFAILVAVFVVGQALNVLGSLSTGWATKRMVHDARTDVYDSMQRLSMTYFEERQTGDLLSILSNDVRNLQWFFRNSVSSFVRFPLSVGVAFVFMASLNRQLATLLLFAPVVMGAASYWYARRVAPVYEDLRDRIGDVNAEIQRNVSGIETIKAYTAEDAECERVRDVASERLDTQLDQATFQSSIGPLSDGVTNLGVLLVIGLGGYWVLFGPPAFFRGSLTPGTLYIFVSYTRSFVGPMRNVPQIIDNYEDALASAGRIEPLRDPADAILEAEDAVELRAVDGSVSFDDVSFAYAADRETIREVSFEAAPGETVGIVGPTAAGKSTLMWLLFRYADPDSGTIAVDGIDVREVTRRSLRSQLGYVEQEPFLFYGTVRENIAYGVDDASDEAVREAARVANAHEF
ncbi:MAG: ABC transporter ATP-binding protein, partial [Halanaeroarchaeum sp.]